MRRITMCLLSIVMLLGTILISGGLTASAQEATPPAEEEPEGASFTFLGGAETDTLPSAPAGIYLLRIELAPGAILPSDPNDPSLAVFAVEAGVITLNVDAPMTVLHLPNAESGPDDVEQFAAGEEFTMAAGDSTFFPANVGGEIRNDGEEDAVMVGTIIEPIDPSQATPQG